MITTRKHFCMLISIASLLFSIYSNISAGEQESLLIQVKNFYLGKEYDKALPLFKQAAETGNRDAENYLGIIYLNGLGIEKDYTEARHWFELAADKDFPDAQYHLGYIYDYGLGVPQDYSKAFEMYSKAKDQNHPVAEYFLGWLYVNGQGVAADSTAGHKLFESAISKGLEKTLQQGATQGLMVDLYNLGIFYNNDREDLSKAKDLYQKAAEQDYPPAQTSLGRLYESGKGVSRDYKEAIKWYRKAAEQDYPPAQTSLGKLYNFAKGVSQDYKEAAKWYRKAAEQGDSRAQNLLGELYELGLGVSQDYKEAIKWYRKAAEQDYPPAQTSLGRLYESGKGVSRDYKEAIEWYRKAAEQRDPKAQSLLGQLYELGLGVSQDYKEAIEWYRKAAEQGFALAQNRLGVVYADGIGVTQDCFQAIPWLTKAAEQGHVNAQVSLGILYEFDRGVVRDYEQMIQWYRKAAEQGSAKAQCKLGSLYMRGIGVPKDFLESMQWLQKAAAQEQTEEGQTEALNLLQGMLRKESFIEIIFQPDNLELFRGIIDAGVDVDSKSPDGRTFMHHAAGFGSVKILEFLRNQGLNIDESDNSDLQPIHLAALSGKMNTLEWLQQHGANIQAKNRNGDDPIHLAIVGNSSEALNWLLENGAELGSRYNNKQIHEITNNKLIQDIIIKQQKIAIEQERERLFASVIVSESIDEIAYDKLYRFAENKKDAAAQCFLGSLYFDGKNVPLNYIEARDWFKKSAEQGYADAQYYLGILYRDGKGVYQDHAEAEQWLKKAMEQGHIGARDALSVLDPSNSIENTIESFAFNMDKFLPAVLGRKSTHYQGCGFPGLQWGMSVEDVQKSFQENKLVFDERQSNGSIDVYKIGYNPFQNQFTFIFKNKKLISTLKRFPFTGDGADIVSEAFDALGSFDKNNDHFVIFQSNQDTWRKDETIVYNFGNTHAALRVLTEKTDNIYKSLSLSFIDGNEVREYVKAYAEGVVQQLDWLAMLIETIGSDGRLNDFTSRPPKLSMNNFQYTPRYSIGFMGISSNDLKKPEEEKARDTWEFKNAGSQSDKLVLDFDRARIDTEGWGDNLPKGTIKGDFYTENVDIPEIPKMFKAHFHMNPLFLRINDIILQSVINKGKILHFDKTKLSITYEKTVPYSRIELPNNYVFELSPLNKITFYRQKATQKIM